MKITEIAEPQYPSRVDAAFVVDLVKRIHANKPDFEEGNLLNRIWRFRGYELAELPTRSIQLQWSTDENTVANYASIAAGSAPPIVFDPLDHSVIDGTHRVAAAIQRGDRSVLAYVGIDPDPSWSEDEE